MQVLDVYTKKEYICKKCNKPVNYGKVATDDGTIITKDKKSPNGKFGKDSNVLSAAVDVGTTSLHECYASNTIRDFDEITQEQKPYEPAKQLTVQNMSKSTELNLAAFTNEVRCAYVTLYGLARDFAPKGALDREIHISTMGLMHDYFSWLNVEATKSK